MRIAIDIDDTLVDTSESFETIKKKYNLTINKKFKDKWNFAEMEEVFNLYLYEVLSTAKIKEDAKRVIDYLNKKHELYIITARNDKYHKDIPNMTIKYLEDAKININKMYFNDYEKATLAKKLNIDLMIDDNISVYNNMKKANIDCILFGDKIKTWKEVLKYIENKEE